MNHDQAKEILLLYRPGTADEEDPDLAEALALARHHEELGRWLKEHCTTQEALRAKFRQIVVPEGLKEQILSERTTHTVPFKRNLVLAAAFTLVLLFLAGTALSIFRAREDKTFANFQTRMIRTVAREYPKMDLETNDQERIRQYLAQNQALADYALPGGLQKTTSTGCAILKWQGKTVSMICFNSGKSNNPNEPDLFLFVTHRTDMANPPSSKPEFSQNNRVATASWSAGEITYLLGGLGNEAFLRKYF